MSSDVPDPRNLRQPDDSGLREGAIVGPEARTRLQQALVYAAALHAGQTRKGTEEIPYIGHLLGVCSLTLEAGGEQLAAPGVVGHRQERERGLEHHAGRPVQQPPDRARSGSVAGRRPLPAPTTLE